MSNPYKPEVITAQQSKVVTQKPMSVAQAHKYNQRDINKYNRQAKRDARRVRKQSAHLGRQYRKNLKAAATENFKEKQLMHGTIRQGLAEGTTMLSQILAPKMASGIVNAVNQNTSGGIESKGSSSKDSESSTGLNGKGPMNAVKYSESERDEE